MTFWYELKRFYCDVAAILQGIYWLYGGSRGFWKIHMDLLRIPKNCYEFIGISMILQWCWYEYGMILLCVWYDFYMITIAVLLWVYYYFITMCWRFYYDDILILIWLYFDLINQKFWLYHNCIVVSLSD